MKTLSKHPDVLEQLSCSLEVREALDQAVSRKLWSYTVLTRAVEDPALTAEQLNSYGEQGWELAGVANEGMLVRLIFKRPR